MRTRARGYEYRSTIACIDTYENSLLSGRFYNVYKKDGERFENLMQFLLKMEQMLNDMSCPQSFAAMRTFSHPPEPAAADPPVIETKCGALATFEIRILFRQNASWQGSLNWLEGEQEESFRSVLELAVLMDSALNTRDLKQNSA